MKCSIVTIFVEPFTFPVAIDETLMQVSNIWEALSVEMKSTHIVLSDTASHWSRYISCRDILLVAVNAAEKLLHSDEVSAVSFAKSTLSYARY